jgi:benzoyl-CoA reductase/2-hydroxyglutaryl-CoA dehydratase subunit BcrC/BadD/HgdB
MNTAYKIVWKKIGPIVVFDENNDNTVVAKITFNYVDETVADLVRQYCSHENNVFAVDVMRYKILLGDIEEGKYLLHKDIIYY